jgi:phage RecT family recombinase
MSVPVRSTAVATTSHVEPPAKPYALSSPIAKILQSPEALALLVPLVPHGVELEHLLFEVVKAATNNPEIQQCTQASIVQAVGTAIQSGLVIGKTIHLVPVNKKVGDGYEKRLECWTDYKGDIELVIWSGAARHVDAQCIYERDHFEHEQGDNPRVVHRPAFKDRGALIGAYCIAYLNGAGTLKKIVVMPLEEIEKIRTKSKQWNPSKEKTCPDWYAMKTTIHRNCKTLPKNRRLAQVIALFDRQDEIDEHDDVLGPANRIEAPAAVPAEARSQSQSASGASVPPAGSATPAPATGEHTIEWARALPFPLRKKEPTVHGRPMGELSSDYLVSVGEWIVEKQKENGAAWQGDTLRAIHLLLADREKDQATLPLDGALADDEDDDLPF